MDKPMDKPNVSNLVDFNKKVQTINHFIASLSLLAKTPEGMYSDLLRFLIYPLGISMIYTSLPQEFDEWSSSIVQEAEQEKVRRKSVSMSNEETGGGKKNAHIPSITNDFGLFERECRRTATEYEGILF